MPPDSSMKRCSSELPHLVDGPLGEHAASDDHRESEQTRSTSSIP
jgi:hypothetical protein